MRKLPVAVLSAMALIVGTALWSAPLSLEPASPQPRPKPGLSVKYAWGGPPLAKIDDLREARDLLRAGAQPGTPLRGLDYRDAGEFEPTLTHKENYNVAADIRGYIRFDQPGLYEIETWSNDGIDATISGENVGFLDGRQPCSANQRVEVEVPVAGWYPLAIIYFQKYSNKCLMMKWGKQGGKMSWVPNSVFGH